jgi:hypothetical protein
MTTDTASENISYFNTCFTLIGSKVRWRTTRSVQHVNKSGTLFFCEMRTPSPLSVE